METPSEGDSVNKLPAAILPQSGPQVLGTDLNRSESGGQPECRTRLSRERRHRRLARRLVAVRRRAVFMLTRREPIGRDRPTCRKQDFAPLASPERAPSRTP